MDWKLVGYAISSLSVLLLGLAAWPTVGDLKEPALIAGMIASVLGMACRYRAHRQDRSAIAYARQEAQRAQERSNAP